MLLMLRRHRHPSGWGRMSPETAEAEHTAPKGPPRTTAWPEAEASAPSQWQDRAVTIRSQHRRIEAVRAASTWLARSQRVVTALVIATIRVLPHQLAAALSQHLQPSGGRRGSGHGI